MNKDQGQEFLARDNESQNKPTAPSIISFVIPSYASGITHLLDLNKTDTNGNKPSPNIPVPSGNLLPPVRDSDDKNRLDTRQSATLPPQHTHTVSQDLSPPAFFAQNNNSNGGRIPMAFSFQRTTPGEISSTPPTTIRTTINLPTTKLTTTTSTIKTTLPVATETRYDEQTTLSLPTTFLAVKALIANMSISTEIPRTSIQTLSPRTSETTTLSPEAWRRLLILGHQRQPGYAIRSDGSIDPNIAFTFPHYPTTPEIIPQPSTQQVTIVKPTNPIKTTEFPKSNNQITLTTSVVTKTTLPPTVASRFIQTTIPSTFASRFTQTTSPSTFTNPFTQTTLNNSNESLVNATIPPKLSIAVPSNDLLPPISPVKGFYIQNTSNQLVSNRISNNINANGFNKPQNNANEYNKPQNKSNQNENASNFFSFLNKGGASSTTIRPNTKPSTIDPFAAFKFTVTRRNSTIFNSNQLPNNQTTRFGPIIVETTIANRINEDVTITEAPKLNTFTPTTNRITTTSTAQSRTLTTIFQPVTQSIALPSNDLLPPLSIGLPTQIPNNSSINNSTTGTKPFLLSNDLLPPLDIGLSSIKAAENISSTTITTTPISSGNPFLPSLDLNPFLPPFSFAPVAVVNEPTTPLPSLNVRSQQSTTISPIIQSNKVAPSFNGTFNKNGFRQTFFQSSNASGFKYTGGFGGPPGILSPRDQRRLHR